MFGRRADLAGAQVPAPVTSMANLLPFGEGRLAHPERLFRPLALDELANLAADGRHHGEQVRVGLPSLVAEELHDPQNVATEQDGKTAGRVQSFACSDEHAGEIRVLDDIGNVGRFTAGPDAAWQPDAGHERARATRGRKVRGLYGGFMPHLDTAQHTRLAVAAPQHAQVPEQALTHGLQELGRGVFDPRRLRQDLGHSMVRQAALLGPLALGAVLHRSEQAAGRTRLVPYDIALTVHDAHLAVGPDHAVFYVVAPVAAERRLHDPGPARPIVRVGQC